MKKICAVLVMLLLLNGCGSRETFETIGDDYVQSAAAARMEILLNIPQEAATPSLKNENAEKIYLCDGYTLTVQTLEAGDLDATIRAVSGYGRDSLVVMETEQGDFTRYDFVWSSAGEGGDQVGRAAVLDDGSYHYAVACMAPEESSGALREAWDAIFDSFWLG